MKDLTKRSLDELNAEIERQLDLRGQFSHNIIGLVLSQISEKYGVDEANNSIELHGLDSLGWSKVKKQRRARDA